MKWLDKQIKEVFRKWKHNEISLGEAAQQLCSLGYAPLEAWRVLENM